MASDSDTAPDLARYRLTIGDNGAGPSVYTDEDPDGDWVPYGAVEWALATKDARIAALTAALVSAIECIEDEANVHPKDSAPRRILSGKADSLRSLLGTEGA